MNARSWYEAFSIAASAQKPLVVHFENNFEPLALVEREVTIVGWESVRQRTYFSVKPKCTRNVSYRREIECA